MEQARLDAFLDRLIGDLGGAFSVAPVRIGRKLGLYDTLHRNGPMSSTAVAESVGLAERYVREWLAHQAASGYIDYRPSDRTIALSAEQAAVLADQSSPVYLIDAFESAAAYLENQTTMEAAFRTGAGVRWNDQPGCLACAIAGFFRPGYVTNLTTCWLPALDGVVEKLERNARVADVGCGHGHSTLIMAEAFPNAEFVGFDFHPASIDAAEQHAREHGTAGNVRFEVSPAKTIPGGSYDLVTFFDCLHDMGDPAGAARHVRRSLKPDGTWMIIEPQAADALEGNLNPVGRLYYAASTMVCVPTSLSQEVGTALGGQAGEKRLREVIVDEGGFSSLRRAAETQFNMILEARP